MANANANAIQRAVRKQIMLEELEGAHAKTKELADAAGLSPNGARELVAELRDEDRIEQVGTDPAGGGNPAPIYALAGSEQEPDR